MGHVKPAAVLQEAIVDELGREIVDGVVLPGHRYTLEALQARFSVSRTVARDVMRVLESLGMVTPRRRVGLEVNEATQRNVHDGRVIRWRLAGPDAASQVRELNELRVAVEPLAASGAARLAGPEVRERLVELTALMQEVAGRSSWERFRALDVEFHSLVLLHCCNQLFAALAPLIDVVITRSADGPVITPTPDAEAILAHVALAAAISAGDAVAAERQATAVLRQVRHELVLARNHAASSSPGAVNDEAPLAARMA